MRTPLPERTPSLVPAAYRNAGLSTAARRLGFARDALALWLGAALLSCASAAPGPLPLHASRPNIVFVLADDHASSALGCYGSTFAPTPRLDGLAREGLRLDALYCTNAICAPSRASILTGLFSHRHGVVDNNVAFAPERPTLPELLQASGYQTALFGKWHLKSDPLGFDRWVVLPGQGDYYNPAFLDQGQRVTREGYVTELITDMALDWLEQRDPSTPFCLMIHHKAPHRNWMPGPDQLARLAGPELPLPPTLFDDYATRSDAARLQEMSVAHHLRLGDDLKLIESDSLAREVPAALARMNPEQRAAWQAAYGPLNQAFREAAPEGDERVRWMAQRYLADYLACIASVDENVGRVLDWLDEAGLRENTLVVYTSDQGFFLGEHGWFDKRFMYDEALRMPGLIRWPGRVRPGSSSDGILMNVDFAPTLLDLAGVEVPEWIQGRSFVPLLESGQLPDDWRDAAYYHYYEYPGVHAVRRHYGLRTRRYALLHFYHDIDAWELYDLQQDPQELRNVHDDPAYAEVRDELHRRLAQLQETYGDRADDFLEELAPTELVHQGIGAALRCETACDPRYATGAPGVLVDGRVRNPAQPGTPLLDGWLGFRKQDCVLRLDWPEPVLLGEVGLHVLHAPASWIHLPSRVTFLGSEDGEHFEPFAVLEPQAPGARVEARLLAAATPHRPLRALRVLAERLDPIPEGDPGAGEPAWLFVDEVVVRGE